MAFADSIRNEEYTREELADLLEQMSGTWANWTPTYTAEGSGTFTSITKVTAAYLELPNIIFYNIHFNGTVGSSPRYITASLPAGKGAGTYDFQMAHALIDVGSGDVIGSAIIRNSTDNIRFYNSTDTDLTSGSTVFRASGFYRPE